MNILIQGGILKASLKLWQIGGFIFTGICGVLLHFLYDWTDKSIIVAPFSAVNESIWEHMKLLFFPMFVFGMIEYKFIGNSFDGFWCAKLVGSITGLLIIPIFYYTYTGVFGVNKDWFNIVIFFIAAFTAYLVEYIFFKNNLFCKLTVTSFAVLCLIAVTFVVLTFYPPEIPLFKDMTTGEYGI